MRRATIVIVGRPNVGKSTLFNRIVGGRPAIVDDRPGVTRDRNFVLTEWTGRRFWLVDTGGWSSVEDDHGLHAAIRQQIRIAIAEADVIVLVVDTQTGVHPTDLEVAELLRDRRDQVVVAANKADDLATDVSHYAFHALGLGDPQPVSAATGRGTGDLLDRMVSLLPAQEKDTGEVEIQVAVVGRPNVGKSSLVNRLLGQERSVVTPEAGTTRDAVDSPLRYHGQALNFIDTAGLRKRSKVEDEIEFYSTLRTERAVERSDVCVLVVDASVGMTSQDLRIAQSAWERGAGLIVAATKWDLVEDKDSTTATRGERQLVERARFLEAVPFVYVSSKTGQRVRTLLDAIVDVARWRSHRVATAEVNNVLKALTARSQPPQRSGQEVKLYYGSQIAVRPPTFAIVANQPEAIAEPYRRYLERGFREAWGFMGVQLRIKLRQKRRRR